MSMQRQPWFWLPMILGAIGLMTSPARAGDYYSSVPYLPTIPIGADSEGATPVGAAFGKEYSHSDWFTLYSTGLDPNIVNFEDHDAFASPDPLQTVSWDGLAGPIGGNSGSVDGFDYGTLNPLLTGEVDAMANFQDLLLKQVVQDEATLLFSVTADLDIATVLPPPGGGTAGIVAKAHVHYEDPAGLHGVWAGIEAPPAGPGAGPGVNHHVVEDLDALEVWGPEPPSHSIPGVPTPVVEGYIGGFPGPNTADANRFSLDGDSLTGTSVWAYDISSAVVAPYIPHSEIVAAVEELFLGPGLRFDDLTRDLIDVDGTMIRDVGDASPSAPLWDTGDQLLFTIDPISGGTILDASGGVVGPAPLIDGGEIMHLVKTSPALGPGTFSISFLSHGGHLWDTAFDVSGTFGYFYEDVDALEAVGTLTGDTDIPSPEPASIVLALLGAAGCGWIVRKQRRREHASQA